MNQFEKMKYNLFKEYAGDKELPITPASRAKEALQVATIQAGIGALLRMGIGSLIKKNPKRFQKGFMGFIGKTYGKPALNPASLAEDAIFGLGYGAINRDIKNMIVRANKNPKAIREANEALRKHTRIGAIEGIQKTSSFWGAAIRTIPKAGKGLYRGTKALGYGMLPMGEGRLGRMGARVAGVSAFPASHRVWGTAVKGGAGFGVYKGIQKIRSATRPPVRNYTSFIRNNILAGNIKPRELSLEDMQAVRKLGMK